MGEASGCLRYVRSREAGLALLGERAELARKHLGKAPRLGIFSHLVQRWHGPVATLTPLGKQSLRDVVGQQKDLSALLRAVFHLGKGFLVFFLLTLIISKHN